ncbi:hypothetical protein GCM10027189_23690 [Rufibacter soli]
MGALASSVGKSHTDLFFTQNGGNNAGTWFCQKLTLRYAQWLSATFSVWVDSKIEELLTTGQVHLQPKSKEEMIAEGFQLALEEAKIYKEKALLLEGTVKQQAPMVAYYNEVLQSENGHAATSMGQDFNMSARALNTLLKKWGVQRKVGDEWHLCSKYLGHGYTFHKKVPRPNSLGVMVTHLQLMWTEKGRAFLHDLFEKKGLKPKVA